MLCRFAHSTVLTSQWTRCTAAPRDSFPAVRGAKTSAFYKIEYSMRSQSSHITCTVRLPTVFTYLQITEFRSMSQVSMINCLEGYISKQPFTCGCWDKDKDVFPIPKKKVSTKHFQMDTIVHDPDNKQQKQQFKYTHSDAKTHTSPCS